MGEVCDSNNSKPSPKLGTHTSGAELCNYPERKHNYFMSISLAPEGSLEKKDMGLQIGLDRTRLSFCKTSQVISGEIAP